MTAPTEKAAPIPADERLWWFLFVLNACGNHGASANDEPGEWTSAFCNDGEPTDTFNRACDLKLATCTHDSMYETSRVWITDAGKIFLADCEARPSLPDSREAQIRAEAAEDERDRLYEAALRDRDVAQVARTPLAYRMASDTVSWLLGQGAMLPADRARARQGGNNG